MSKFTSSFTKNSEDSNPWVVLTIRFEDGKEEEFLIELTQTGTFVVPHKGEENDWTRLEFQKCPCCPLDSKKTGYCPAAESLESTLLKLKNHFSYERVEAEIRDWANRKTIVKWQLQEVGSTFVHLAVFASNCPIGKQFKPLLRDLRPFSTNEELTKHLISKFLLKHRGKMDRCKSDILEKMEPLRIVFSCLAKRISGNMKGDAIANSIVRLDAFALNVSLYIEEVLEELRREMGWFEEHMPATRRLLAKHSQKIAQGIRNEKKVAPVTTKKTTTSFLSKAKQLFWSKKK